MSISTPLNRRQMMQVAALGASSAVFPLATTSWAAVEPSADRDPDAVLAKLMAGNQRFVKGELKHPRRSPEDFAPLVEGQAPLAVIVGCSDSRCLPEIAFDQGVGDLFVARVAGNIVDGAGASVNGSIEYAVAVLGVRLVMVLGHSQCGAVEAAIKYSSDDLPGAIGPLVKRIRPAVEIARTRPGNLLENAIQANVEQGVKWLKQSDPILAGPVKKGTVQVVGAEYDLRSGKVRLLE